MKSKTLKNDEEEEENDDIMCPSEFAFAITRIAVAQICQSVGFRATQHSALDTLTDVAARHLRAMAESAASSATSSGRTQSNLYDLVRALEDLASVQGFRGASNVNQTLLSSSPLADLAKFVKHSVEIPFAKPIRRSFPPKQFSALPGNVPNSMCFLLHIPRWLPAIPDMNTSEIDRKETQEEVRSDIDIGSCGVVDGGCLVGEKMGMELPEKRPRVRFKMGCGGGGGGGEGFGMDLRSGVCRGGKRVSCGSGDLKEAGCDQDR